MCQPYIESATALSDIVLILCMIKVRIRWSKSSL